MTPITSPTSTQLGQKIQEQMEIKHDMQPLSSSSLHPQSNSPLLNGTLPSNGGPSVLEAPNQEFQLQPHSKNNNDLQPDHQSGPELTPLSTCQTNEYSGVNGRYEDKNIEHQTYISEPNKKPIEISINDLTVSENKDAGRKELETSFKENGFNIYLAIQVKKSENGTYEVLDGHNRLASMMALGATTIPCFVLGKNDPLHMLVNKN